MSVGGTTPLAQTFHYNPDGTISRTHEVIDFGGQTTTQTVSYGFDDLSRVTTATASAPELSQSVSGYDANGNINSIAAQTAQATFTYVAGSNRLDTVSLSNGPPLPVWDPATALYDLHARLYDPTLARFLAPDPARQFASPYIYAADDPIMEIDPSGATSIWAQIGIGAAMAGIAAIGIISTIPSGGASDELAAAGDAALAGSEAGAAVGSSSLAAAAAQIGGSTLAGIGIAGGKYDVTHGSSFSWEGFGSAVAGGAAAGAVGGGIGFALSGVAASAAGGISSGLAKFTADMFGLAQEGVPASLEVAIPIFSKVVVGAATGAISGTAGGLARQEVNNAVTGNRWNSGLDSAAATGAWQGAAVGGALSGAGPLYRAALAKWPGLAFDVESIQVAASSDTAKIYYGLIGGHVALGWGLWGFYKWESHSAF